MRVIESKRNPRTGERYHYCPKSQGVAQIDDCIICLKDNREGSVEPLPASYRIHCPFGEEVKAIIPYHVEDQIPKSWGEDKFNLTQYSIVEPKLDGARCVMLVTEDGIRCFGRRNNRFGDQSEFTDNVPHIAKIKLPGLEGTLLDGEIIVTSKSKSSTGNIPTGTLGATMSVVGAHPETAIKTQETNGLAHIYIFDVPKLRDRDLTEARWIERHDMLVSTFHDFNIPRLAQEFLHLMPYYYIADSKEEKIELYKQSIKDGAEGVVLKNPQATYYELRANLKVKQDVTFDAVVSGFEYGKPGGKYENTVGTLLISVIDKSTGELREIGKIVPGDDELRADLYKRLNYQTPEQILSKKIIVWVQCQSWTKEYRIRHSRILEYCQDRTAPSIIDFSQVVRH